MRVGVVRIELDRALEFPFSASPVTVVLKLDMSKGGMRFGERTVNFQSFVDRSRGFRKGLAWRKNLLQRLQNSKGHVRIREAYESKRVRRIFLNRLTKVLHRLLRRRFGPLVPVIASPEQRFVRVAIDRPDVHKPRLLV